MSTNERTQERTEEEYKAALNRLRDKVIAAFEGEPTLNWDEAVFALGAVAKGLTNAAADQFPNVRGLKDHALTGLIDGFLVDDPKRSGMWSLHFAVPNPDAEPVGNQVEEDFSVPDPIDEPVDEQAEKDGGE